jgi:mono/diheme cytochrome c family protein
MSNQAAQSAPGRMGNRREIRTRTKLLTTLAAVSLMMVNSSGAWADDLNDVQAGRELAVEKCSSCHADNPVTGGPAGSAGRSLATIAKSDKAAPDSLPAFLRSAHNSVSHPGNMPNPELTEQQIRLISAYLVFLRASQ